MRHALLSLLTMLNQSGFFFCFFFVCLLLFFFLSTPNTHTLYFSTKHGETIKYNFKTLETPNIIKEKPFISSQKPKHSTNHPLNLKSRDPNRTGFTQSCGVSLLILTEAFTCRFIKLKSKTKTLSNLSNG